MGTLENAFAEARRVLDQFSRDTNTQAAVADAGASLAGVIRAGGKILAVGNGGSACDASHFCEELTGRFRADRRPLAAIACIDPGHITCTANDYGFEHVFSRWVTALARPGDALVALSTSGKSPNIVAALRAAKGAGARTIGLLGHDGGACRTLSDHAIVVPGATSDRIQELHMLILHAWVELIEVSV